MSNLILHGLFPNPQWDVNHAIFVKVKASTDGVQEGGRIGFIFGEANAVKLWY